VTSSPQAWRLRGFRQGKVPSVLRQADRPLRIRPRALEDWVASVMAHALPSSRQRIARSASCGMSEGSRSLLARFTPGEGKTDPHPRTRHQPPALRTTKGLWWRRHEAVGPNDRPGSRELIETGRGSSWPRWFLLEDRPVRPLVTRPLVSFSAPMFDSGRSDRKVGSADDSKWNSKRAGMIPGFFEGKSSGMALGENREVRLCASRRLPQEERARRKPFAMTLKISKARELAELDDALRPARPAKRRTLAEMRADLEQRLRDDSERRSRNNRHEGPARRRTAWKSWSVERRKP